jgi:hypothetical protein
MDIELEPSKKSTKRKDRTVFLQLRLPLKLKKAVQKLAKESGMSTNTYMRALVESAASGAVVVQIKAVQIKAVQIKESA